MSGRDLSDVLLLIPCCGSKKGDGPRPRIKSVPLGTELSGSSVRLLEEGRQRAFLVKPDALQPESPLLPAMVWYTGNPYKVAGFRAALDSAFERGLRCLIISAGYGLLRPDDPIHKYDLRMAETLPIWKRRLPEILADYISRNGVKRVFGTLSAKYFEAVADVQGRASDAKLRWCVPQYDPRAGGAPVTQIPEAVGHAVIDLVRSDFNPDECRKITPTKNLAAPASPPARVNGKDVASSRSLPTKAEREPGRPPGEPRASKGADRPRRDIEEVWQRIQELEGEKFSQKEGRRFQYSVGGSHLKLSTTNQNLARSQIEKALPRLPLEGPGQINNLRCPSYIFGILMDARIRKSDW